MENQELKDLAIRFRTPFLETCKKLTIERRPFDFIGEKTPKMYWVKYCPNYHVERNGFEVCYGEKIISLAYCYEKIPFRFKNACTYVLVENLKRLKDGCVYESWIAPQFDEIMPLLPKKIAHKSDEYYQYSLQLHENKILGYWHEDLEYISDLFIECPDGHIAQAAAELYIKLYEKNLL